MGLMIVQHHSQFIRLDTKKSYPKQEKRKLILEFKSQEKHCKVFAVWECSVFKLSLVKIFCQSRISPKEISGANGKFLPKPLLFHLRHPNSKTNEPKFCQNFVRIVPPP